jgi:D-tagatose-1,6-bisphosphate aldolase subunit GatZ/KbaZ
MKALLDIVDRHKRGEPIGIWSLCSAHPLVLEAAMDEALASGMPLLVEATSNQVNQFGGYTGLTPAGFHRFIHDIADRVALPRDRLWLGGDHLGPNAWRNEPAAIAMARAEELVAQYVEAGFRKLHLDCSMPCGDDRAPMPESTVAERAARLCNAAERAWERAGGEKPVYVIGTEVPIPGGAAEELGKLAVTRPEAVAATIETHRRAFAQAGLAAAWPRAIALVVQPGVEFDNQKVVDYRAENARALSAFIAADPQFVFEAHSTDYQTPENLRALVCDHFAILKVGPAATFAMRETLWALAAIGRELPWGRRGGAGLREAVTGAMRADPRHWRGHYHDPETEALDLEYGLSDRVRYYWPQPDVERACTMLLDELRRKPIPLSLVSQYLPRQYTEIRAGRLDPCVDSLLRSGIAYALRPYLRACGP